MIKINLLPQDSKGKQRTTRQPGRAGAHTRVVGDNISPLVWLFLAGIYIVVVVSAYFTFTPMVRIVSEKNMKIEEHAKLKKEVKAIEETFEKLKETAEIAKMQAEVIDVLMPKNPLLWSEKLNQLALLIPNKVYMTSFSMNEKVTEKETAESKKARKDWKKNPFGEEPRVMKRPIITNSITINGVTVGDESDRRLKLILDFIDALKYYDWNTARAEAGNVIAATQGTLKNKSAFVASTRKFGDHFKPNIKLGTISTTSYGGVVVSKFRLDLTTKPVGGK